MKQWIKLVYMFKLLDKSLIQDIIIDVDNDDRFADAECLWKDSRFVKFQDYIDRIGNVKKV